MRYMLLVKATKEFEEGALPDEAHMLDVAQFTEDLVKAGALVSCERLKPSKDGVRVRFAHGKCTITDGPFAETKELVAGFCLIQANSLEEAIEWAKRIPLREGEVEVRPLFELEDFPVDPSEQPEGWRDKEMQLREAPLPTRKPGTTRYLGLLKADSLSESGALPDPQVLEAMGSFIEEGTNAGFFITGEGLKPSAEGARVRYSGTDRLVLDGPFAETKELVAGYAILQFASKAEMIEWTKRFVQVDAPGRQGAQCECEMRPIFEFEEFAPREALDRFRNLTAGAKV